MAKRVQVVLNNAGVRSLLHECGEKVCVPKASEIAGRCGDGYASDSRSTATRTMASVFTDSPEAMAREMKHNNILRNLK